MTPNNSERQLTLPTPDTLRQYDAVIPGSAHRIMAMAENQQRHNIDMAQADSRREDKVLALDGKAIATAAAYRKTGLWMGFAIATAGFALGTWLFAIDHNAYGLVLTLTPLAGLAAAIALNARRNWRKT